MISKKMKYAMKALRVFAINYPIKPIFSVTELSDLENIPKNFLETILLELKNDGILTSVFGKNGGYMLVVKPEELTLARLLRLIDGPIAPTLCVSLHFYGKCSDCMSEEKCSIRPLMRKIRDANLSIYETMTIKDLI